MSKRPTAREIIERIRTEQAAPASPADVPSVHILWGVDEATGKANPPPTDPETLRAMDELIAAAYKTIKEGKLPPPRKRWREQSDAV